MSTWNIRLGDTCPDFTLDSTQGKLSLYEYMGDEWVVLFSHPAALTPVCTTEMATMAKMAPEFAAKGVKLAGFSCDAADKNKQWIEDIVRTQGVSEVPFPIFADEAREVSVLYNMLDQNHKDDKGLPLTVRSVFVIDDSKKLRLTLTYPASTGRSGKEILRVVDSLKLTSNQELATPAGWEAGGDCVVPPNVSDEQAAERFPKGVTTVIEPYLRMTPDPR